MSVSSFNPLYGLTVSVRCGVCLQANAVPCTGFRQRRRFFPVTDHGKPTFIPENCQENRTHRSGNKHGTVGNVCRVGPEIFSVFDPALYANIVGCQHRENCCN
jgi:hypothetical protein